MKDSMGIVFAWGYGSIECATHDRCLPRNDPSQKINSMQGFNRCCFLETPLFATRTVLSGQRRHLDCPYVNTKYCKYTHEFVIQKTSSRVGHFAQVVNLFPL